MFEHNVENIVQENSALRNENAVLKEELALANQQLEWFRKQIFGRKTEQTSVIMDGGVQLSMFDIDKKESAPAAETVTVPAHEKWCMPIVYKMHELLISGQIIHADETTVQVLHEEGRKPTTTSRMWVYCNGKMNDRKMAMFLLTTTELRMR